MSADVTFGGWLIERLQWLNLLAIVPWLSGKSSALELEGYQFNSHPCHCVATLDKLTACHCFTPRIRSPKNDNWRVIKINKLS